MPTVSGRLFAKERVVSATNVKFTAYDLHYLNDKGVGVWSQVRFKEGTSLKGIEVPGLVELNIYSAGQKTTQQVIDGETRTYVNKILRADSVVNIKSLPAFEEYEAKELEAKINQEF